MRGEPEEPAPVLNHSQEKLRGLKKKKKAKPNQLNIMQDAKKCEGMKTRIKDIALTEETEDEMEVVTELSKCLRSQNIEY